jgi:uncharacterized protein
MLADEIIERLGMKPHPEGGFYAETWRDEPESGGRGTGTAIYFLLRRGERSHWHRVDAVEIWHFYAGASLELSTWDEGRAVEVRTLGNDLLSGQAPQLLVPAGVWQAARTCGDWTLVGCTVSPAFVFDGFELAAPGWEPRPKTR